MKKLLKKINDYMNEYNELCAINPEIAQQMALAASGLYHY